MRRHALFCALAASALLASCTADSLRPGLDIGARTASVPRLLNPKTYAPKSFAMSLRPDLPGFGEASMPAEEVDCRKDLSRMGVKFRDLPAISEGACGIDWPVEVSGFSGAAVKPAAVLNCTMAATFARWTRKELAPAIRGRYFTGIGTIHTGSTYSCRSMIGAGTSKLSEHAKGNAIDIMGITLDNGKDVDVRKPGLFAFRQKSLLASVRTDACDYFSTVLGPGYNKEHADHFHFDMMERRSGYKACK